MTMMINYVLKNIHTHLYCIHVYKLVARVQISLYFLHIHVLVQLEGCIDDLLISNEVNFDIVNLK